MGYIEQNLMKGEKVKYRAYPHWIIFARAGFWTLLVLIGLVGGTDTLMGIGIIATPIALIYWLIALITKITSEYGITNKRLIMKTGFIRRDSIEIMNQKIESVAVTQSILGRILGYGRITVAGTGASKSSFKDIAAPIAFRAEINEQL